MNSYFRAIAKHGPATGVIVAVGSTATSAIEAAIREGYRELDCDYRMRTASQTVGDCLDDPDLSRRIRESDRRRYRTPYDLPALPATIVPRFGMCP